MLGKKITFTIMIALSIILLQSPSTQGQVLPGEAAHLNPNVVTFWHKMGIPQSFARTKLFRDSLVNRDGLNPGKERKPRLLRIADPANLAEDKPQMLQTAAKMKIDQDLAPQKIKALKYIGSIGCSCYNKQSAGAVEAALMEGLKDCTVDVRIAAIQVVLDNAGSACSCEGQCETCCSPGVVKLLEEMAYKMTDDGCYVEPNASVRAMAAQALAACPPLPPEPQKQEEPKEEPKPDDPDLKDKGENENGGQDGDLRDRGENDGAEKLPSIDLDGKQTRRAVGRNQQVSYRSDVSSFGSAWTDPALEELQIQAVITSVQADRSNVNVELVKSYQVPVGSQLVIASDEIQVSFGTIISSQLGQAMVKVDDAEVLKNFQPSQRVRLGVLEQTITR